MLKPLQQGLMAIHLVLEDLGLPNRIAAFEGNVLLKDFGGTAPMPGTHIARLQGITCSRVTPTLEPTFEALMARPIATCRRLYPLCPTHPPTPARTHPSPRT
jgi:hypothetical protein